MSLRALGIALGLGGSCLANTVALAQETTSTADTEARGALEEITVTARRREENIQDVPVAITALSANDLATKGVTNLEQIRTAVPALQISPSPFGPSVPGYTIRSQRQLEQLVSQDPSVGVYFADVVQTRPHGSNQALYDLASVQVLKGPQGTLFGRNTTGGAVLITPNRPVLEEFSGSATVVGGNYDLYGGTGVVNLPVGETLAMRFGARVERRDGYAYNITRDQDLNDSHFNSFRLGVLWQPTEGIESYTLADYFDSDTNGVAFSVVTVDPNAATLVRSRGLLPSVQAALERQRARDPLTVENNFTSGDTTRAWGVSNNTTFDLGFATLKNIIGYRAVVNRVNLDFDGVPVAGFDSRNNLDVNQYSEELQLLGTAYEDRLSYIVGGYLFREQGRDQQISAVANLPLSSRDGWGKNQSRSLFGQVDYKLLDNLTLTAGVRQTWDTRRVTLFSRLNNLTTCRVLDQNNQPLDPCERELGPKDYSSFNYLVAASYKITPDVLLYATHSTGYRSGGFSLRASSYPESEPFDPEEAKNYEAGIKAELLDQRLRISAAGYYVDYQDIQRTQTLPCNVGTGICTTIENAATARVRGYEIEATAVPLDLLSVSAFIGYSDAKYQQWVNGVTGQNLAGNRFAMAPETTYGATVELTLPVPTTVGALTTALTYYHQSSAQIQDLNNGGFPGYGLLNATAAWLDVFGKPLDVKAFINNIEDKRYYTGGVEVLSSASTQANFVGDPRNYGVSLTYRF